MNTPEWKVRASAAFGFALIITILVSVYGWVSNLLILIGGDQAMSTAEVAARVAGIFFYPLGAIMGFI